MRMRILSHLAKSSVAIGGLCLFLWLPASAQADAVITFNFSGSSTFSGSSGIIGAVGTYTIDFTTDSVVGPWFFDPPFLTSSDPGASAVFQPSTGGYYDLGFSSTFGFVSLTFNPQGQLVVDPGNFWCENISRPCSESGTLTSGSATATATPEPQSLILLGTGFLALLFYSKCRLLACQKAASRHT